MPTLESFPRGGALPLKSLEYRDVVEQATLDTLAPTKTSKRPAKDAGEDSQKKPRVEEEKTPAIDTLTFKVS